MAWISLKIEAKDYNAELLSDTLMELGAISESIEDANVETPDEQPTIGKLGDPPPGIWQKNVVSSLLDEDADLDSLLKELSAATGIADFRYSTETIAEQNWVRATQSQTKPIRIRDDLCIMPSWHDTPNQDRLNSVLDYGYGFGILAVAARKLGAGNVVSVDINAQAIQSGVYNAWQNQTNASFYLGKDLLGGQFDIAGANILSSARSVLATALVHVAKPGDKIALSGILREQIKQVGSNYQECFNIDAPVFMIAGCAHRKQKVNT